MTVHITNSFAKRFTSNGYDPQNFIRQFDDWKRGYPNVHLLFGKDSPYVAPEVNGRPSILYHVHMMPMQDEVANTRWRMATKLERERVSDRALVYVPNDARDYLLLGILEEPEAHEIARMKTEPHKQLMKTYAAIAGEFILTGKIIA